MCNKAAGSVDGEIILCIQGGSDCVVPILNGCAIRQSVLRAFRQGDDQFISLFFIDCRAFRACNRYPVQNQAYLVFNAGLNDHLSCPGAGQYIIAFFCNQELRTAYVLQMDNLCFGSAPGILCILCLIQACQVHISLCHCHKGKSRNDHAYTYQNRNQTFFHCTFSFFSIAHLRMLCPILQTHSKASSHMEI